MEQKDFYTQLQQILCADEGGRGLPGAVGTLPLRQTAEALLTARRVVIVTGFPVDCPGGPLGETDGPCGAADMAAAFTALGCEVNLVTDRFSLPMVQAAAQAAAPGTPVYCVPQQNSARWAERLLSALQPTHLIAIERPGRGADGHYHNMRGVVLDRMVADTDTLFLQAKRAGVVTVAVGDGGNELGMGALAQTVARNVPCGARIAAVAAADYTLVSGVSNWWGWGMAALLGHAVGRDLLPTEAQATRLLAAVVAAGGVDGCTSAHTLSVDAMPLASHLTLLRRLQTLTCGQLAKGA